MCMRFKQAWTVTMAGYWDMIEQIVCSYQPVQGSQIVWWGRIKTSKAKIIRARLGKEGGGGGKNRLI